MEARRVAGLLWGPEAAFLASC